MKLSFLLSALVALSVSAGENAASGVERRADDVAYDLLPGMGFSLKARIREVNGTVGEFVRRSGDGYRGGYFLRVDPPGEARLFSFFVDVDGSPEPRVSSRKPVKAGVWYDLAAGWDGTNVWLSVDGEVTKRLRVGPEAPAAAPLCIGSPDVEVKDFRFNPGRSSLPPDTSLAAGFRINCALEFDEVPTAEYTELIVKPGEYMIRYENGRQGGGAFSFFVFLDGSWEPRVSVPLDAKPHVRYDIYASWDGLRSRLELGGKDASVSRRGVPSPKKGMLRPGRQFRGKILRQDVRVSRQMRPVLEQFRTDELTLWDGRPFTLRSEFSNVGEPAADCAVVASVTPGATISPNKTTLGTVGCNERRACAWKVDPGTNTIVRMLFDVFCGGRRVRSFTKRVATMPEKDPDRTARAWNPPVSGRVAHYVDSENGDDERDGLTPATAWRTFAPVNALCLGPGERLLLKRGSVFREELRVRAKGSSADWAEIGAYGEGPRPTIRRYRDIDDRCALIEDAEYLVVRDLVVCNAGKGLIIECKGDACKGHVLVERCLAHHIEGLYRFNSHGIPEWRDREGAPGRGRGGIGLSGPAMRHGVLRDCEMYQCSSCFSATGDDMWVGRMFCHDSFCPNTSPHPFYTSTYRAWLLDSVFEASGYLASCGTMGIMLGYNQGFVIGGSHFINMPHSGLCGDEGGIDFEAGGDNAVIRGCTFRNNAGAAIEVLGLRSPQSRNNHFVGCRFDRDNHAHVLGPSEIYIWGGSRDRTIVCSNGLVEDNGYVLLPGVSFFTNVSKLVEADWTLRNNREFASFDELDRAMPLNNPPIVSAGDEIWTDDPEVALTGRVADDGRGRGGLAVVWEQLEGPETVRLTPMGTASARAVLPRTGDYRFLLRADDGQLWRTGRTAVHLLPKGTRLVRAWDFSHNLDNEGWTTNDLGTVFEKFPNANILRSTHAYPVASVGGDFYVIAVKESAAARITSSDALGIGARKGLTLLVRMQNHTTSDRMRVFWTTDGMRTFDRARSVAFDVVPEDEDDTLYSVPLPAEEGIRRLQIAFADGKSVTGTVRIDYIAVVN